MGLFGHMKDMVQTVRSDELRELNKKAGSQPRMSMLEGVRMANQFADGSTAMQQQWQTADPTAYTAVYTSGVQGTATVHAISETGIQMNDAPVCELDLTVVVPGREPYQVKHRQLLAISVLPRYQPGATFSVRVDQSDPSKLVIG